MKRLAWLIAVALVFTFGALNARAQEEPKRKTPKLSMDNFEGGKMIAPSGRNSGEAESKSADATPGGLVSVNPRALLKNAFAQLEKVKSLRMRMKVSDAHSADREMVIETVRPDRVRLRMTGMDMISIGSTVYFKTNDEPWKATTNESFKADAFNPKDLIETALLAPGVSMSGWAVGEETLAGTSTTVYEISIEEQKKNRETTSSTLRLWLGKSDGMPRKMELSAPNSAMKMNVSYSDFNTNIVINAPRSEAILK